MVVEAAHIRPVFERLIERARVDLLEKPEVVRRGIEHGRVAGDRRHQRCSSPLSQGTYSPRSARARSSLSRSSIQARSSAREAFGGGEPHSRGTPTTATPSRPGRDSVVPVTPTTTLIPSSPSPAAGRSPARLRRPPARARAGGSSGRGGRRTRSARRTSRGRRPAPSRARRSCRHRLALERPLDPGRRSAALRALGPRLERRERMRALPLLGRLRGRQERHAPRHLLPPPAGDGLGAQLAAALPGRLLARLVEDAGALLPPGRPGGLVLGDERLMASLRPANLPDVLTAGPVV